MKALFHTALILIIGTASATEMSSANYSISWDATDGGGGLMTSASYVLVDSVGQPSAIGSSASENYMLQAGFHSPPDTDTDLVRDFMDNCSLDPNTSQFDSDDDGFGNLCDADLNDDLFVNLIDLALFRAAFLTDPTSADWNPDADFNNDDVVNLLDLAIMRVRFLMERGRAALRLERNANENLVMNAWFLKIVARGPLLRIPVRRRSF